LRGIALIFLLPLMQATDLEALPRTIARRVRTLGHALTRVQHALQLLPKRLERGLVDASATAWIHQWAGPVLNQPAANGDVLKATVAWQDHAWLVSELPPEWTGALLLLHLPVLRDFWRRELREMRYERLRRVLPKVWARDTTVLPPGSVIAGLGIKSWDDLPRLEAKGRRFETIALHGKPLVIEQPQLVPEGTLTLAWSHYPDGRVDL